MAAEQPQMKKTLGLTGLTMNAMALIAPGAFLWLTFAQQCQYGAPLAADDMWFGVVAALILCFATAISYAELSKLYPGAGSSYFFAEQAFLSKTHAYKFARLAKFVIGWSSHLYYWIYPGAMVAVTAVLVGYLCGQFFPEQFNDTINSPTLMIVFCVVFSYAVAYIAYRGVTGTTAVNVAINVIQITALIIFSIIALAYRVNHDQGAKDVEAWTWLDGKPARVRPVFEQVPKLDDKGKPVMDDKGQPVTEDKTIPKMENGKPVLDDKGQPVTEKVQAKDKDGKDLFAPLTVNFDPANAVSMDPKDKDKPTENLRATRHFFKNGVDVVRPHNFFHIIVQACIAILILVGFESVTAMAEEAKDAKRDVPRAVLLSLFVQGVICYLIQYFAACYFLNSNYGVPDAANSSAPIGDITMITCAWLFNSEGAAKMCMLLLASTVFLALVGTTLACLTTGARVTYAMGRDDEVPAHFGLLHGKNLTPHRSIWALATVSAVVGILGTLTYYCGPAVTDVDALQKAIVELRGRTDTWTSIMYPRFMLFDAKTAQELIPQSLLTVILVSNFGTFMLYMLTNVIAIVAFREHHTFSGFKHMVVPVFGAIANLTCMLFYLVGPLGLVENMSTKEPFLALAIAGIWGAYGWFYFVSSSKAKGKAVLLTDGSRKPAPV